MSDLNLPYLGNAISQPLNPPYLGDQPAPIATGGNYTAPYALATTASDPAKEDKANKGIANGYAPLDATSKVPSGNLPPIDVSGQIATHNSATTSVHGIANTANLIRSGTINVDKSVRLQDTEFNVMTDLNGALIAVDGGASLARISPTEVLVENVSNGKAVAINTDKLRLYTYSAGVGGANIFLQGTASGTDKTITLPNVTGTVALTSDSRFTDSRTPTAHTHAMSDVTSLQATLIAFAIALG